MKKLSAWARARTLRRKTQGNAGEREGSKDDADLARANGQPISSTPPRRVPNIPQHFLLGSSNDGSPSNRPGSNTRIKPVLIGVSRPSDTFSRPDTAGSLQSAVNWAADRVAQSSPGSQKSHTRTHSARHVDIFSVSRPGTSFPVYNEDVASRNSEVTKGQYVPSSMYQEEVAARNAPPPLRSASDQTKHVPNFTKPRTGAALEVHPEYSDHDNDADIQKVSEAERAVHHEDLGAKELAEEPAAPMNLPTVGEKSAARLKTSASEHVMETLQNDRAPHTQPNFPLHQLTNSRDEPIDENDDRRNTDAQSSNFLPPNEADKIAVAKLSANQKTPSELPQHHEGDTLPVVQSSASKQPLIAERAPSSLSNTSSVKQATIMPNRTVVDSTGDDSDALSDGYPESFTSASPGVGDVHQDTYSKPQLSVAGSAGAPEHSSDYTHYSGTSNVTLRQPTSVEPEQGSSQTTIQHPSQSSFSSINVLVSLLPVSQQEIQPVPEPNMVIAPLGIESRKPALNKLYTVAETEPEVEDSPIRAGVTAPLVDKLIIPPSSPVSPTESTQPESSQTTPTQVKLPSESQWSSDLTDPSSPYGIRTRDFALTPRKETDVPPENALPKRNDRAPGTSAGIISPPQAREVGSQPNGKGRLPVTPVKSKITKHPTEFNEEAFQRKQEQARAALIKLQHSLNEDFDDATPQAAWAQPQANGVNRYSNSSSSTDGRPHAPPPTYSLGQVLGHHRTATSHVNGAYHPRETSLPRTSFSMSEPPTSPRSISSMSSAARPLHRRHSPMHSLQETTTRMPIRKRGDTNPSISEMRRLVYEMTQPKLAMPNPLSQDRMYEPSLPSFPQSPEEVSLSSFPLPVSSLSATPDKPAGSSRQKLEEEEEQQQQPSYPYQQQRRHQPYHFTFEPYDMEAAPSPVIRPYSASPSRSRHRQKLTKKGGHSYAASSVSLHSIPAHLIPDRGSSMRDFSVRDDDEP